jgi:hypothetical protein
MSYDLDGDKYNTNHFTARVSPPPHPTLSPQAAIDEYNDIKTKVARDTAAMTAGGTIVLAALSQPSDYIIAFMTGGIMNVMYQVMLTSKIDNICDTNTDTHNLHIASSFVSRMLLLSCVACYTFKTFDIHADACTIFLTLAGFTSGKVALVNALNTQNGTK